MIKIPHTKDFTYVFAFKH